MKQILYADILFVVNFIINFYLLKCVQFITSARTKAWRLIAASALGAAAAFIILLPPMYLVFQILYKIICCVLLCAVAFKFTTLRAMGKNIIWLTLVTSALAGAMIFIMYTFAPSAMSMNNLTVYFNVSPIVLVLAMLCVYIAINVVVMLLGPPQAEKQVEIELNFGGDKLKLSALYDTAFKVKDILGERQVVMADYKACEKALPKGCNVLLQKYFDSENLNYSPPQNATENFGSTYNNSYIDEQAVQDEKYAATELPFSVLPIKTATGGGVLPAFLCDCAVAGKGGKSFNFKVLVAFSKQPIASGEYAAIVGPNFINQVM